MKRRISICTIILCLAEAVFAQAPDDRAILSSLVQPPPSPRKFTSVASGTSTNELKLLFSGMFLFYKAFISSQDQQRCTFSPSCSEYGMLAVKKYGFARGYLAALDRFARCNGLNHKWYDVDVRQRRLLDPVQ